jgi:hypothetical protein
VVRLIGRIQEFALSLGPAYVRVLIGSILIMSIGLLMFSVGLYVFGDGMLLFPGREYAYPAYYENIVYEAVGIKTIGVMLTTTPKTIYSFKLGSPGYFTIEVSSSVPWFNVRIDVVDSNNGKLIYSIVLHNDEQMSIPIYSPGDYKVNAYLASNQPLYATPANIRIELFAARESTPIIIARWLQLTGLSLIIIGFLIMIFSYKIAMRAVETQYYIPPEELRTRIASESYLRIHVPRTGKEDAEEE